MSHKTTRRKLPYLTAAGENGETVTDDRWTEEEEFC